MIHVAALYIDPRGPYPKLLGSEMCWDEHRDARTYAGPWPVVAHPPCGPWSSLRHLHTRPEEKAFGLLAIKQVRRWGGVVEQPASSRLFLESNVPLPFPGECDSYGGFVVEVEQCAWGHVARKRTWLYCVGVPYRKVIESMRTGGTPTHWCSGGRTKRPNMRGPVVPHGIKVCSAQQRRRTPVAFAEWLISLADQAHFYNDAQTDMGTNNIRSCP